MDNIAFLQQLAGATGSYGEVVPAELFDPFVDANPSPSPQPAPSLASIQYAPVFDSDDEFEPEPILNKRFFKLPDPQPLVPQPAVSQPNSVPVLAQTQAEEKSPAANTHDNGPVKTPPPITTLSTAQAQPTVDIPGQKPRFVGEEFADETDSDESSSDSDGDYLPPSQRVLMSPTPSPSPSPEPDAGHGSGSSPPDSDYDASSEDNNELDEELDGDFYNGSVWSSSDSLLPTEDDDQGEEGEEGQPKAKSPKRCGFVRCLKKACTRSIRTWNTLAHLFQARRE